MLATTMKRNNYSRRNDRAPVNALMLIVACLSRIRSAALVLEWPTLTLEASLVEFKTTVQACNRLLSSPIYGILVTVYLVESVMFQ
jgi:hypothetical protein